jgi:hypothetical protein
MMLPRPIGLLCCCLSAILAGCMDQGPLGSSLRRVAGNYYLEQSEAGLYYLRDGRDDASESGVLEGSVERLVWTPRYILARRRSLTAGIADGWMLVDTELHTALGPFSDRQMAERSALPRASEALTAAEAWRQAGLGWHGALPAIAVAFVGLGLVGLWFRERSTEA